MSLWGPEIDRHGNLVTICSPHNAIHHGEMFFVGHRASIGLTSRNVLIKVGATAIHIEYEMTSSLGGTIDFFEGTTVSSDGTVLTPFNRNRVSQNSTDVGVFYSPSITSDGVSLDPRVIGSEDKGGGKQRSSNEWVLKPNTNYLARLTSTNLGNTMVFSANWYHE